jgi:hypothetical protein
MCLNDNNRMNNRYASAALQVWWMCSVLLHGYYRDESLYACGHRPATKVSFNGWSACTYVQVYAVRMSSVGEMCEVNVP